MTVFIDCLYGQIRLDIQKEILSMPELQRLRGIRLCNINSPYITGGDSLNRFEHAIGTTFLAQNIVYLHSNNSEERSAFLIASLLHDVVTAPFGHSLEYLFEALKNREYEHANIFKMFFTGKTIPFSRNIYLGKKLALSHVIKQSTLNLVIDILDGKHRLSTLLNHDIDIDNIDNVFRFSHHIGIEFDKRLPLQLTRAIRYEGSKLIIDKESLPLFQEWFRVRETLYLYLLENAGDFVAKSLLERCFIETVQDDIISENDWILTDYDMVIEIFRHGNDTAQRCLQRLMLMEFPLHSRIVYTEEYQKLDSVLSGNKLRLINFAFEKNVFLHFIRDVNKTRRVIIGLNKDNLSEVVQIGQPFDRYLIGFFSDDPKSIQVVMTELEKSLGVKFFSLDSGHGQETQIAFF